MHTPTVGPVISITLVLTEPVIQRFPLHQELTGKNIQALHSQPTAPERNAPAAGWGSADAGTCAGIPVPWGPLASPVPMHHGALCTRLLLKASWHQSSYCNSDVLNCFLNSCTALGFVKYWYKGSWEYVDKIHTKQKNAIKVKPAFPSLLLPHSPSTRPQHATSLL